MSVQLQINTITDGPGEDDIVIKISKRELLTNPGHYAYDFSVYESGNYPSVTFIFDESEMTAIANFAGINTNYGPRDC